MYCTVHVGSRIYWLNRWIGVSVLQGFSWLWFSFVYPVCETAITSAPERLSYTQVSIIISPGQITTGGIGGLPSAQIVSMIVADLWVSGLVAYNSLT